MEEESPGIWYSQSGTCKPYKSDRYSTVIINAADLRMRFQTLFKIEQMYNVSSWSREKTKSRHYDTIAKKYNLPLKSIFPEQRTS